MSLPKIVITAGEPAGIGPDIVLQCLSQSLPASLVVIGDPQVLRQRMTMLGLEQHIVEVSTADPIPEHDGSRIHIIVSPCHAQVEPGVLNADNSAHVIDTINTAADLCRSKTFHAMVTAPVHKAVINQAGIDFSGHTEWIAKKCDNAYPVMMLANNSLRVCLATTHLPLSRVPDAITPETVSQVLRIMNNDLASLYDIKQPIIGVCGLNPHAGEGGYLGDEEIKVIAPCIEQLNNQGLSLVGPLPADTAFTKHQLKDLDAVLAMYHDQGLPVIKHAGFGNVVNVTLGLPIIRTSVDHGTALDLAGTGDASATSLLSAIHLAITFANNQAQ